MSDWLGTKICRYDYVNYQRPVHKQDTHGVRERAQLLFFFISLFSGSPGPFWMLFGTVVWWPGHGVYHIHFHLSLLLLILSLTSLSTSCWKTKLIISFLTFTCISCSLYNLQLYSLGSWGSTGTNSIRPIERDSRTCQPTGKWPHRKDCQMSMGTIKATVWMWPSAVVPQEVSTADWIQASFRRLGSTLLATIFYCFKKSSRLLLSSQSTKTSSCLFIIQ